MQPKAKRWHAPFDKFVDDWMGLTLPRPRVALEGFEQSDGCSWCGVPVADEQCDCAERRLQWSRVFRLGTYGPPLSTCILQGKYMAWPEMLELLGLILGERIKGCVPPRSIVVPVPMPLMRRWFRRIDHTDVIARHVARAAKLPYRKLLSRSDATPQAALTATGRKALKGRTMRKRIFSRVRGRSVILVDDVLTTGRTLEVAARTLRSEGAISVIVAVLAVTDMPRKAKKCDLSVQHP